MWWDNRQRLRIAAYMLLFVAATFAVIYVSFWTEEGTVARNPGEVPAAGPSEPAPRPAGK